MKTTVLEQLYLKEASFFSTTSPTLFIICLFDDSYSERCEVASHYIFICISLIVMLNIFSYIYWPFVCLLGRGKVIFYE